MTRRELQQALTLPRRRASSLSDPTKFFGIELGAQSKVDDKNERYIVNGVHDAPRLRDVLDVFIDKVGPTLPVPNFTVCKLRRLIRRVIFPLSSSSAARARILRRSLSSTPRLAMPGAIARPAVRGRRSTSGTS